MGNLGVIWIMMSVVLILDKPYKLIGNIVIMTLIISTIVGEGIVKHTDVIAGIIIGIFCSKLIFIILTELINEKAVNGNGNFKMLISSVNEVKHSFTDVKKRILELGKNINVTQMLVPPRLISF